MTHRVLLALAVALVVSGAALDVSAQRPAIPRTLDGKPDLQGTWDSMTGTPVERPKEFEGREFMTKAEAGDWVRNTVKRLLDTATPGAALNDTDLNDIYPEERTVVDLRTALVTEPADGKIPPRTAEGQKRFDNRLKFSYDDPETRPFDERCLLAGGPGGGSASAPPLIPNQFGQNNYQIVQTRDTVLIYGELIHDARIVRIGGEHRPESMRFWLGDSVGRWEGDTLVVDTTNFNEKRKWRGSTENLHVVERFTRLPGRIRYQFTVEDPATWATPWSGEVAFLSSTFNIPEYACHEGNYAVENGLRGARADERAAKK